jgi:hypothetical protein
MKIIEFDMVDSQGKTLASIVFTRKQHSKKTTKGFLGFGVFVYQKIIFYDDSSVGRTEDIVLIRR